MEYSEEQQIAFNKYVHGNNIFITGPGGSGKSELIRMIYKDAYSRLKNIQVFHSDHNWSKRIAKIILQKNSIKSNIR